MIIQIRNEHNYHAVFQVCLKVLHGPCPTPDFAIVLRHCQQGVQLYKLLTTCRHLIPANHKLINNDEKTHKTCKQ